MSAGMGRPPEGAHAAGEGTPVSAGMNRPLDGKVAIVTGSTQGLGLEIARVLSACGAHLVVVGRNAVAGGAVAAQLQQHGVRALYCATDIERDEEIDKCVARTIDSFGRLDILVNNACTYADRGFDAGRAEWLQSLNVNLVSAAIFTQKAVVHMRRGSVIVNLGSTGGKFGAAGRALYPAAKAALLQMTKNLAVTLAPRGIRAVAVSPAWTWSPAIETLSQGSRAAADAVAAPFHPLGRVGDGSEVGHAVAFLASDAASWITGVDIPVDGGFSVLGPDRGIAPRAWFERSIG
ncbi:short-chain dehydrogenase/reductase SDR [Verminephrobacter eiseniae EF01-2]|uniref:Short-chain dehydrogenase/reductase SDR n=2 Tax=Verminephrobacter eiseniae TaxID=364317 RepID=A1WJD7_VEREI|nr:short-chain dehydrogenase/reductase SDR [Verminephrobacter eiseniae EF01-2]